MTGISAKSITAFCMALLLAATFEATADVSTWLNKIGKAYGGEEQIMAASAFQQFGVTFSKMRGSEGKMTRSYRYPDHLRIAIDYGGSDAELRLLAGPHSWKQSQTAGEPFYSAMILQATRLGLPAVLFAHKKNVKDGGEYKDQQGRTLHILELRFHKSNHIAVGIDPETGRIAESASTISMETFKMQFGTRYDDYRKVNGRLFAFKETHYVMGRETGYTHLESIVIESLADELFYPDVISPDENKDDTLVRLGIVRR
jgi:hypothetical protein